MSEEEQNDRSSPNHEKVVPDAIFPRLEKKTTIFCLDCNKEIPDRSDIAKHYNKDHPSTTTCIYCNGKSFNYTYTVGSNKPQVASYHKCSHKNEKE